MLYCGQGGPSVVAETWPGPVKLGRSGPNAKRLCIRALSAPPEEADALVEVRGWGSESIREWTQRDTNGAEGGAEATANGTNYAKG